MPLLPPATWKVRAEAQLIANGQIPSTEIPLVIQDKTFVPGATQLSQQDPTWNSVGSRLTAAVHAHGLALALPS